MGMGGKQEQGQPWDESQFMGMGGRSRDSHGQSANLWERKASRNRATGAFLLCRKGMDSSKATGAFLLCRKGTDSSKATGAFLL